MDRHIRMTIVGAVFGCLMVGSTSVAAQQLAYLATAGTLQVIDTATNQIVSTSAAGIADIVVSPDGARLYTYTFDGGTAVLQVLDAATKQVTATIPLSDPPTTGSGSHRMGTSRIYRSGLVSTLSTR